LVSEQGKVKGKFSYEKEERVQAKGKEVQFLKLESYGLTIMQIVAVEGEKTCSNLERGVLNWF